MKFKTKQLVYLALNIALVCVATIIIRIPSTMGYKNLGDAIILFAALFFGPVTGAVSGGIGAAMADLLSGYASYAPFTLVIKLLEGLCAGLLFRMFSRVKFNYYASMICSVIPAALLMAAGYFLTNLVFLNGEPAAALADFGGDLIQGALGVVCGLLLLLAIGKTPEAERICGSSSFFIYRSRAFKNSRHKKAVVISDISGLGRCSYAVQNTIINASGNEAVCLPTAVLSAQTGFENYAMIPLPQAITLFSDSWQRIGFVPDAVLTGFLTDPEQAKKIGALIKQLSDNGATVVIDPIMGDNGVAYDCICEQLINEFKSLVGNADVIVPNLTEACLLADEDFNAYAAITDKKQLIEAVGALSRKLAASGPKKVVVTGVRFGNKVYNFVCDENKTRVIGCAYNGKSYSGTGDIMSAVVTAEVLKGIPLYKGVKKAVHIISRAIADTEHEKTPEAEGIDYQNYLYMI